MELSNEIKKAIKRTLVIENKQSIDIAVDKIMKIIKENYKEIPRGYHDVEEYYKE